MAVIGLHNPIFRRLYSWICCSDGSCDIFITFHPDVLHYAFEIERHTAKFLYSCNIDFIVAMRVRQNIISALLVCQHCAIFDRAALNEKLIPINTTDYCCGTELLQTYLSRKPWLSKLTVVAPSVILVWMISNSSDNRIRVSISS